MKTGGKLRGIRGGKKRQQHQQTELPGVERKREPEIERAALAYVAGRDERMQATEDEADLARKLLAAMKKAGRVTYRMDDDRIVRVVPTGEKVSVRKPKPKTAPDVR